MYISGFFQVKAFIARFSRLDYYDLSALVLVLAALVVRLIMIALGWPGPFNDEGTVGLMALHIAYQGAHPLLYYGQDYMGPLEAYIGAVFFHLLGPSLFALRLGLLVLFDGFLLWMYRLTTLLYSKGLALVTLLVLAAGSPEVIWRELMAAGGPPDYLFFTTLLMLLTVWLAFTARSRREIKGGKRLSWQRLVVYAGWGMIAGLDLWGHLLCIPFVVGTGILLLIACRHELRLLVVGVVLVFLVVGVSPQIIYKLTVPVSSQENSIFSGKGYREPVYPIIPGISNNEGADSPSPQIIHSQPAQQFVATLLVAIPVATNGNALCPLSANQAWPITAQSSTATLRCTAVHGLWGLGLLFLWFVATVAAIQGICRVRLSVPRGEEFSLKDRREFLRQMSRLTLLLCTGITLLAFICYPQAAAVTPWYSARYLVGLLIAIPALLAPLWERRGIFSIRSASLRKLSVGIRVALVALVVFAGLVGTLNIFTDQIAQARISFEQQHILIGFLLQEGLTRIYTDYNDCNSLAFLSHERVICAVLDDDLHPGLDRYFPYRAQVAADPSPAYVFVAGSTQAFLFEKQASQRHLLYEEVAIADYLVYIT